MHRLLKFLKHPEHQYPIVQVVGTNGKGSTASFLAAILQAAGYRTGLFTSPHLIEFRERFQVNGLEVEDKILAPLLRHTLESTEKIGIQPVFFDTATAMAAQLFAQEQVDIAILEAGMGARLDATTALPAHLTILTQVGCDHSTWLGTEIRDIARDKAAGFRPHRPGVLGVHTEPALSAILEETERIQPSSLWRIGIDFPNLTHPQNNITQTPDGQDVQWWHTLSPGLQGTYQKHNLSLALAATALLQEEGFHCSPAAIRRGVKEVSWPGRMQKLRWNHHDIWLDGAHNPSAMKALLHNFHHSSLCLIFGAMQDKELTSLLQIAIPHVETLILCPIQQARSASPKELLAIAQRIDKKERSLHCVRSLQEALQKATSTPHSAPEQSPVILLAGSLYLVGEALAWWRTLDTT